MSVQFINRFTTYKIHNIVFLSHLQCYDRNIKITNSLQYESLTRVNYRKEIRIMKQCHSILAKKVSIYKYKDIIDLPERLEFYIIKELKSDIFWLNIDNLDLLIHPHVDTQSDLLMYNIHIT